MTWLPISLPEDSRAWIRQAPPNLLIVVGVLVVIPFLAGTGNSGQILVLMVFAIGYNFLFGYSGQMSFGHAAFYGLGAYGTILSISTFGINPYIGVLVGVVLATVVSLIVGKISFFRRGVYFAMITLALAQMIYYTVLNVLQNITGGGQGSYMPSVESAIGPLDPMGSDMEFYLFAAIILLTTWLVVYRVVQSPFGSVLIAIRENEQRVNHLGLDSDRFLTISFAFSGLVAGLAGGLYAILFQFVTPQLLFWSVSGTIMLITILGGAGTFNGPIFGVLVFQVVADWLTGITSNWPLFFGALFIVIVLFAPEGINGLLRERFSGVRKSLKS